MNLLQKLRLVYEGVSPGIELIDKTDCWKDFVKGRMEKFIENRDHNIKIHNTDIVDDLEDFYKKMAQLFTGKNL
jgi:hypothetical protein